MERDYAALMPIDLDALSMKYEPWMGKPNDDSDTLHPKDNAMLLRRVTHRMEKRGISKEALIKLSNLPKATNDSFFSGDQKNVAIEDVITLVKSLGFEIYRIPYGYRMVR